MESQGGPNAEAMTGEAEETLKWWTQRNHCDRPRDSPGMMGYYLPRWCFGFMCIVYEKSE